MIGTQSNIEGRYLKEPNHQQWFDEMVATLRSHELQLETGLASKELAKFYETLRGGSELQLAQLAIEQGERVVVLNLILSVLNALSEFEIKEVWLNLSQKTLNVWVKTKGRSTEIKKAIILKIAEINASIIESDFFVDEYIVSDKEVITPPKNYFLLQHNKD